MFRLTFVWFFTVFYRKTKENLRKADVFRKIIEFVKRNNDFQRNICFSYVLLGFSMKKHEKQKNLSETCVFIEKALRRACFYKMH